MTTFSLGLMGVRKTSRLPGTLAMYRTSGSVPNEVLVGLSGGFAASSNTDAREVASTVGVVGMSRAMITIENDLMVSEPPWVLAVRCED